MVVGPSVFVEGGKSLPTEGASSCGTRRERVTEGRVGGSSSEGVALGLPATGDGLGHTPVSRPLGLEAGTCGVPGLSRSAGQVRARSAQPGGALSAPALPAPRLGQSWGKPGGEVVGASPSLALSPVFSLEALVPFWSLRSLYSSRGSFVKLDGGHLRCRC